MSKTHHIGARRAFRSFGWLLTALVAGCGDERAPSPIAPGAQSSAVYQIMGTVADHGGLLPGAVVTIVDGPLAGTGTRSNDAGNFEFRGGSPGTATLRVSLDGFQTRTGTAVWQPLGSFRPAVVHFVLESLEPPIGLEPGTYTLVVAVDLANARDWKERPDTTCAGFPSALASRSYRAEINGTTWPGHFEVTAEDPALRWRDLFGFNRSGSYVQFDMEGGIGAGIYEDFPDFPGVRYLHIGGFTTRTRPAVRDGSSVSIPFEGAISHCRLKSSEGPNLHCYQVPAEQILEHHVCLFDRATMVFTPR